MLLLGSHVSFGTKQFLQSVTEAISYGANTFMFYTGAPQNTIRKEIDEVLTLQALTLMKENRIDINNVICHAPYIVNLATSDSTKAKFAVDFIKEEIKRCSLIGISKIVLHPGSSVGITKEEGLDNIVSALNEILNNPFSVEVLLETMAGKGNERGINTEELAYIINNVKDSSKLGVCLDTCHLNDSGINIFDFDSYLIDFDKKIGLNKIGCIHINDSKNALGTHKDRHANIGFGTIGYEALSEVIYNKKLENIPKILETPFIGETDEDKNKIYPPYKFEIEMIKSNKFDSELLNKIREYYRK